MSKDSRDAIWGWSMLIAVGLLIWLAITIYDSLTAKGFISHDEEIVITADPSWLLDESKECLSIEPSQWFQTSTQEKWLKSFEEAIQSDGTSGNEKSHELVGMTAEKKQRVYLVAVNHIYMRMIAPLEGATRVFMKCDSGTPHRIKVSYYGNLSKLPTQVARWKCIKKESSFSCFEQTSGESSLTDRDILRVLDEDAEDRNFLSPPQ